MKIRELDRLCAIVVTWHDPDPYPGGERSATLGDMLGRDHVAWVLRQAHPRCVALSRAAGCWTANMLDHEQAYHALARALE